LAKIKIDFFDLFGVGGAGWRCRSFFLVKNTAIGFFFEPGSGGNFHENSFPSRDPRGSKCP
jgi:hypothetical protein